MAKRGGWLLGRDGSKPGWYGSWQNLNDGPDGEPVGPPYHGRAYVHPTGSEETTARVEWVLGSTAARLCVNVDSGDGEVVLCVALPPVALYLGLESRGLRELLMDGLGLWRPYSGRQGGRLGIEREASLSFHDLSLWWRAWQDPNDWREGTPRWREGNLNFDRLLRGRAVVTRRELERREVSVPMPEGPYAATAVLEEVRVEYPRWPTEVAYTVTLDLTAAGGIPVPGKGESAHDCEDDAILQSSERGRSIPDAIGELVGSVLARRERHGGRGWLPPPKAAPAPAEAA